MRHAFFICLVTLTLAACGCKNKSNGGGGPGTTGGDPAMCDAHAARVQGLYVEAGKAAAPADEKPEAAALREQEARDNSAMALADCRTAPTRFAPCLEKAVSVEQLERDCLIPLDDEGRVEGDYFEKRNATPAARPSK